MTPSHRVLSQLTSLVMAVIIGASTVAPGLAVTPSRPPQLPPPGDDAQRAYHDHTGKLRFLAAQPGQAIAIPGAQEAATVEDKALAALSVYAQEFGLSNPAQELQVLEAPVSTSGSSFVRYQQVYQGVPVLAGEMIVSTDEAGNLLSMSGEVSPEPSLSVTPDITSEQARATALEAVAKWYELTPADLTVTEPELWIYDERLLLPSARPAELVWRMEVTATDLQPIDELVLVNAHTGGISLHFNQIDAAWGETPPTTANVMLAPTTYYVATTGNDANSCTTTGAPCATINGAIGKAANGDTIKVAVGTYLDNSIGDVIFIPKDIFVVGGWNASFTMQVSNSTIDGEVSQNGVFVPSGKTATVENFTILKPIYNYGDLTINNSVIRDTGATGINNVGTMVLNRSVVSDNSSSVHGGGIYNNGALTINNSSIYRNTAGVANATIPLGGGIFSNGTLTLNNSTVSENKFAGNITGSGGGVYNEGSLSINNSTIVNNMNTGVVSETGTATLQNTILGRNTTTNNGFSDCSGVINSSGYNLIENISNCTFNASAGDLTGVNANIGIFIGTPGYYPLLPTSPAINAGNPAGCYGSQGLLGSDQRGASRVGRCDIGAYEYTIPGPATGISVLSGTPQQTVIWSPFAQPLQVLVLDSIGSPVNNSTVTFTAPASGASAVFSNNGTPSSTAITDGGGIATSASFIANGIVGSYEINATVAGVVNPAKFFLENVQQLILTYTANHGTTLPGVLVCNQSQPACSNNSDPHADAAHRYANDTYSFYLNYHNRASIDNISLPITSTVHYGTNYANAFWNGSQMVYGDAYGFPLADDVVAHELTHGVTQFESNLFYYYQSGAINESFSDVWGEFVDLTNGAGNDSATVKWKMGEDVTGHGAYRDMKNPPTYGDPDKMTSPLYVKTASDNGGVHTNSGINNKAVFLMTDGGTFNGKTVTGLGIPKVAAIYYEVQTNLLTSGSDYADLYYALSQACANLLGGPQGIANEDCQSVRDAADAVQMNSQPATGYNPEATLCPTNMALGTTLFFDDLETNANQWTPLNPPWYRTTGYAVSGIYSLYGDDSVTFANYSAVMNTALNNLPANAFLHFKHAFGFEDFSTSYYDGGVLEYSTDGGMNWFDAKPLFSDGKNYSGTIPIPYGNPLGGRQAFVADSHGYVSSRYNLSSLAGQNIRFLWRVGTDFIGYDLGWLVDDVRIYTCVGVPGIPSLLTPAANGLTADYTPTLDWADSAPGLDHYQIQVDDNSDFLSLLLDQITTPSTYTFATPLIPAKAYYWRVRAFNATGQASDWSPTRTLYTAVVPPTLNFPASNFAPSTTRPLFDWTNVAGATSYTLQISTSQNFTTFVLNAILTPSAYVMPTDLPRNTLLFWRARANGAHGSGDWSRTRHFFSANPPGVPVLVSPANNATATSSQPTLDWNDSSPAADYYEVQLSTFSTFATFLGRGFSGKSYQSNYAPSAALSASTTYFWRVRAVKNSGAGLELSSWSAVRSFATPP